ncbi:MAG: rRNA pseudouridine synthase, partial [Nanoarchaeota archaeon]|nr:rRNA pseudouridine synthase [Nanoarchaeota archaeon]
ISKLGIMSRNQAEKIILEGKVCVNDKKITKPKFRVDIVKDKLSIDNKTVSSKKKIYYLLNKPEKVVTTRFDPEKRKTVYDFVKVDSWIFPVGRLDYDTSGLLIMTNDSRLAEHITNPSSAIWKTYIAKVKGKVNDNLVKRLEQGVNLNEGKTLYAKIKLISSADNSTRISISIHEGKNRQIKRMFQSLGIKVLSLKRIAIGNIQDDFLKPGQYRELTSKELKMLEQ